MLQHKAASCVGNRTLSCDSSIQRGYGNVAFVLAAWSATYTVQLWCGLGLGTMPPTYVTANSLARPPREQHVPPRQGKVWAAQLVEFGAKEANEQGTDDGHTQRRQSRQ